MSDESQARMTMAKILKTGIERRKQKAESSLAAPSGSANTPLKANVENGILTVQIGIETLEWSSKPENGGPLEDCKVDGRRRREWAEDVVREMERDNEVGESPLARFLDEMMEKAANNGSGALCWPNDELTHRRTKPPGRAEDAIGGCVQ